MRGGAAVIIALIVKVGQDPEIRAIVPTLPTFQALVGGYIEAVHLDEHTVLYCNEDALSKRLPFNCYVGGLAIRGDFFLVRDGGSGEECSLKPAQTKKWLDLIHAAKDAQEERKKGLL